MNEAKRQIIKAASELAWEYCVKFFLAGMVAGMLLMWAIL